MELATQLFRLQARQGPRMSGSAEQAMAPTNSLDRFVGRYQLAPTFIFDIKRRREKLMVGITNQATQQVYQRSDLEFAYSGIEASLLFGDVRGGKAQSVTLL